ncbi:SDR family NAD(P)-dependent oxidoreductase [Kutzneria buriramensis]|uniref:Bifunctional oxygenase/reductase n=1 Tax=Kutzneria buriramensis TaxID=1045776 RepID=A0A3E0GX62_9PSEU|nr:SDR family oxidoreductase [Kutzneria buriramensis]REH32567.1 bifunctional oxygenase/reductase [Kutzneria buriramensis]
MPDLTGRTALITGASRGIGRATALRLAADGAAVAVHYSREEAAAKEVVNEIGERGGVAFAVAAELGAPDGVDKLFAGLDAGLREHTGGDRLDILVNNAAVGWPGSIESIRPEDFDRVFAVNARAPFFVVQQALPRLNDGGRIINVSSVVGRLAFPADIAYAMTKGALDVFTRHLAKALAPRQITVNSVAPGVIDTSGTPRRLGHPENWDADSVRTVLAARSELAGRAVLGRMGRPEEVADVVAFVASPDARWITGDWFDVSGGSLL